MESQGNRTNVGGRSATSDFHANVGSRDNPTKRKQKRMTDYVRRPIESTDFDGVTKAKRARFIARVQATRAPMVIRPSKPTAIFKEAAVPTADDTDRYTIISVGSGVTSYCV